MSSNAYRLRSFRKAEPEGPVDRTLFAIISLQIGATAYILIGILLIAVFFALDLSATRVQVGLIWLLAILSIVFGALSIVVARGLRRRRRRSWRAARILFIVLYLPTVFLLPVGVFGLYGLMSKGTREKFFSERRYKSRQKY